MTTTMFTSRNSVGILFRLAFLVLSIEAVSRATGEEMSTAAGASTPAYALERTVEVADLESEELVAATFDSSIYAGTREGYPDLRLFNSEGKFVPHRVRRRETMQERVDRKSWSPQSLEAKPLESGGLEIRFTLKDDDPVVDGLRIVTPLRDFEQRVTVAASDDGEVWRPVVDAALIFDYSKYLDVRREEVPLATTPQRHWKIVIDSVTSSQESELMELTRRLRGDGDAADNDQEGSERTERLLIDRRPFRIDRIDLWNNSVRSLESGPIKTSYPPVSHTVEEDEKTGRTVIVIESQREPLTSLFLVTSTKNFSRRVTVEVERMQGTRVTWEEIGSAILSRVDFKTLHSESLELNIPETRAARLRMVIDNRDSPPLTVTGIEATGPQYEVLFLAAPGDSYRLTYGASKVTSADYDTAAIDVLLSNGFTPKFATLGAVTTGTRPTPETSWTGIFDNVPLMSGVILLLVLTIGWGLFQAMKRVDQMP